jgi:hypothetical protein
MRKINRTILAEERWVTNPDDKEIRVKLRRFPVSQGMYIPGVSSESMWSFAFKKFDYCILEWEGINNEEGNLLECNSENKKLIYDYIEDLMMWISVEIKKLKEDDNTLVNEKKT